jgi:hypothetical protein
MLLLKLCAIFAAGIFIDFLVARYTRAVTEKRPLFAASLASVITITNLTLLTLVLAWTENSGVLPIATYAGGSWLGTFLTVRQR